MIKVPFNRPFMVGTEFGYMKESLASGKISGDGDFTRKCSQLLEGELSIPKILLTTSCTHALEMAALLLDLSPGDEVIVPSFTFVSTINAFVLRGARPVFADIREDTLNIDETKLENLITERTRAIVVVHYAGVGCEMDSLMSTSYRHEIPVIEDNAHGLFGRYKEKSLGSFGVLGTQSFHETKNFSCGEGGALLINDESLADRAEIIREKGTNRSRFFRGQVDKYTWVDLGSSYLPSDLLAAFLYGQLEARNQIQASRAKVWNYYYEHLADWARINGVRLPVVPQHCEQTYHMFYMVLPTLTDRQRLIKHLAERGVHAVFHYVSLHLSPMGTRLGGRAGDCPVTEKVSDTLVRLPLYNHQDETDVRRVVDAVLAFSC